MHSSIRKAVQSSWPSLHIFDHALEMDLKTVAASCSPLQPAGKDCDFQDKGDTSWPLRDLTAAAPSPSERSLKSSLTEIDPFMVIERLRSQYLALQVAAREEILELRARLKEVHEQLAQCQTDRLMAELCSGAGLPMDERLFALKDPLLPPLPAKRRLPLDQFDRHWQRSDEAMQLLCSFRAWREATLLRQLHRCQDDLGELHRHYVSAQQEFAARGLQRSTSSPSTVRDCRSRAVEGTVTLREKVCSGQLLSKAFFVLAHWRRSMRRLRQLSLHAELRLARSLWAVWKVATLTAANSKAATMPRGPREEASLAPIERALLLQSLAMEEKGRHGQLAVVLAAWAQRCAVTRTFYCSLRLHLLRDIFSLWRRQAADSASSKWQQVFSRQRSAASRIAARAGELRWTLTVQRLLSQWHQVTKSSVEGRRSSWDAEATRRRAAATAAAGQLLLDLRSSLQQEMPALGP